MAGGGIAIVGAGVGLAIKGPIQVTADWPLVAIALGLGLQLLVALIVVVVGAWWIIREAKGSNVTKVSMGGLSVVFKPPADDPA